MHAAKARSVFERLLWWPCIFSLVLLASCDCTLRLSTTVLWWFSHLERMAQNPRDWCRSLLCLRIHAAARNVPVVDTCLQHHLTVVGREWLFVSYSQHSGHQGIPCSAWAGRYCWSTAPWGFGSYSSLVVCDRVQQLQELEKPCTLFAYPPFLAGDPTLLCVCLVSPALRRRRTLVGLLHCTRCLCLSAKGPFAAHLASRQWCCRVRRLRCMGCITATANALVTCMVTDLWVGTFGFCSIALSVRFMAYSV